MGRIAHVITMPAPPASEQLHPSMAVVCMDPAVLPVENALTSRSCTLEYVTAATPSPASTGYGHAPTLARVPSFCAR